MRILTTTSFTEKKETNVPYESMYVKYVKRGEMIQTRLRLNANRFRLRAGLFNSINLAISRISTASFTFL